MAPYGGFDHNAQSFKAVTRLERKYAGFDGLNLTLETLEGLAKHNGPVPDKGADGSTGHEVLRKAIAAAGLAGRLHLDRFGPAEAQAAAIADDIAYNSHDIDDGLRAGFIAIDDLRDVPLAGQYVRAAPQRGGSRQRAIYEVNRRIITDLIDDAVREARTRLAVLPRQTLEGVREAGRPVVALSPARQAEIEGLQRFLFANVYRHPRVMRVVAGAEAIVRDLFGRYMAEAGAMPVSWRDAAEASGTDRERAAVVADFVAGMTDRFAIKEHHRLFDATPELR
jgi:dGTPase